MWLALAAAAAAAGPCEFGASADGRFCCPKWCGATCGGTSGDCPTTLLEEVGRHACADVAPPCLVHPPKDDAELDEQRAMAEIDKAIPDVPGVEAVPELELPADLDKEADLEKEVYAAAAAPPAPEAAPPDAAEDAAAEASVQALLHAERRAAQAANLTTPPPPNATNASVDADVAAADAPPSLDAENVLSAPSEDVPAAPADVAPAPADDASAAADSADAASAAADSAEAAQANTTDAEQGPWVLAREAAGSPAVPTMEDAKADAERLRAEGEARRLQKAPAITPPAPRKPPAAPLPAALSGAEEQALPQHVSAGAGLPVRLVLPENAGADAAIEAEVRGNMAAELDVLSRRAAARLKRAREQLWGAERARAAAIEAATAAPVGKSGDGDHDLVAAGNLSAPPLYARLLPDFADVQGAVRSVVDTERAWEARGVGALRATADQAVRHTLSAAKAAQTDRKRLVLALHKLDAAVDATEAAAGKVRKDSNLGEVDPGLLTDLERLRGVVFVEEGDRVEQAPEDQVDSVAMVADPKQRSALLSAEMRYRLAERTVAAAELEQRSWAAAASSAAMAEARVEPRVTKLLRRSVDAEPNLAWGEEQLEGAANSWRAAAAGGVRAARRQSKLLAATRTRTQAAATVARRDNGSLATAVRVATNVLHDANGTLAAAYQEYVEEVDVGAVHDVPAFNRSLHTLAGAVSTAIARLDAVEEDRAQLQDGAHQLAVVAEPLAGAAEAAGAANRTMRAAAAALDRSVQSLDLTEADGAADRVARAGLLRR